MGEILLILGLILLNGLFSMAEIALVSARKARPKAQKKHSNFLIIPTHSFPPFK
jgi:CBS domain containing-hemolysin-like protein